MRHLPRTFLQKIEFKDWLTESEKAREWVVAEHKRLRAEKQKAAAAVKRAARAKPGDDEKKEKKSWKIKWDTKSYVWKDHKKLLIIEYDGKCMYCEGRYVAGTHDAAEHFAPKGEVTVDRQKIEHPGYYWMAFEWQNILLACDKCNSTHPDGIGDEQHDGKLNEFPVDGQQVPAPGPAPPKWWEEIQAQKPRLLHPYFDRPEQHLGVKKGGYVYGTSDKGRETVDICDLNRPWLRRDREDREKLVRGLAFDILDRLEADEDFDDLLHGYDKPFSLYINLRMEQYARTLHERAVERFAKPKGGGGEAEEEGGKGEEGGGAPDADGCDGDADGGTPAPGSG